MMSSSDKSFCDSKLMILTSSIQIEFLKLSNGKHGHYQKSLNPHL